MVSTFCQGASAHPCLSGTQADDDSIYTCVSMITAARNNTTTEHTLAPEASTWSIEMRPHIFQAEQDAQLRESLKGSVV